MPDACLLIELELNAALLEMRAYVGVYGKLEAPLDRFLRSPHLFGVFSEHPKPVRLQLEGKKEPRGTLSVCPSPRGNTAHRHFHAVGAGGMGLFMSSQKGQLTRTLVFEL